MLSAVKTSDSMSVAPSVQNERAPLKQRAQAQPAADQSSVDSPHKHSGQVSHFNNGGFAQIYSGLASPQATHKFGGICSHLTPFCVLISVRHAALAAQLSQFGSWTQRHKAASPRHGRWDQHRVPAIIWQSRNVASSKPQSMDCSYLAGLD